MTEVRLPTKELNSNGELIPATPATKIMALLDEAIRRTDLKDDGEFGIRYNKSGKPIWIWHHESLDQRINDYIESLTKE